MILRGGVRPRVDRVRHPDLLSVGLPGLGRLHTHEAWMAEAWRRGDGPRDLRRWPGCWRGANN